MLKFLSKQEIIEKLQSLPDLPVVIERDTDVVRSTVITKIEVVKAYQYKHNPEVYVDYNEKDQILQDVIWIS
jgi:hypothetical protein